VAGALYKSGKLEEAASLYRALGENPGSPLAPASRFNLGNALFGKQDFPGAVRAYRDALRLRPDDQDARRNLEMALRAMEKQQKEEQEKERQQQQQQKKDQDQKSSKDQQGSGKDNQQPKPSPSPQENGNAGPPGEQPERPKSEAEKEQDRFEKETGMPKERAMQLLDALQQNEKAEQKRLLAERARPARKGKDW